jgi:hypothetical protein
MTSLQTSSMTITNNVWTFSQLLERIKNIKKPKFNRDLVWDVKPQKNTKNKKQKANFKEYILFLMKTNNSVFPLSLGSHINNNQEFWYAIDGNNRINAIHNFLMNPYKIFNEYYKGLFQFIDSINNEKISKEDIEAIKNSIHQLTYKQLSTFNRLDEQLVNDTILDNLGRKNLKEIEGKLIEIQKKMRSKDGTPFDTSIRLVINEFKHGTNTEYCQLFEDINKYANTLSQNELLAATLFEVNVVIQDSSLKCEIIKKIVEYYDNRGQDEVLEKHKMDLDYNMEITAYDFMVGFQNLCSNKYEIISNFTHNGTSMFFKMYNNLYESLDKTSFTNKNINDFIEKIIFACSIVRESYNLIMPVNINQKYFNSSAKLPYYGLIADNSMVTLLMSNIANKDKLERNDLVNKNRILIIYHLLCDKRYLKNMNDDCLKVIRSYDRLMYEAGGSFVDNACVKILNGENKFTITKEQMSKLLKHVTASSYNNKKSKSSSNKRRQLNIFDKILLSTFWFVKMSKFYIEKEFETEHIVPFASTWEEEGEIDIDRIGNLFPTLKEINGKRGNKNLDIYFKEENKSFTNLICDLLPLNYDEFNLRNGKKTSITSIEKYNEHCINNEELYMKTLLDNLFPDQL